eukprot:CAMPEP_0203796146 /NCGR_PEP_ID=MMETSP0100_2-20121128/7718_1 /ASSEMBLY_ACC=CAM_ASM_000210 /TAXON_ID=96639 /ORGANISM=" , Strain NY0313808BC1" /LENGTH=94 /DNA_ID=CAMNT_0050700923 /DNA_START=598 /DNA_END=882 /DNA_ORIENTATION=-
MTSLSPVESSTNLNKAAPTKAPSLPDAADNPLKKGRTSSSKVSAGRQKVVAFGPKLKKKNVAQYNMKTVTGECWRPRTTNSTKNKTTNMPKPNS